MACQRLYIHHTHLIGLLVDRSQCLDVFSLFRIYFVLSDRLAGPLGFCQAYRVAIWDFLLVLSECGIVYLCIEVNRSFHGFLIHRLALFLSLFLLSHAFALPNYVWKLSLLLWSLRFLRLKLVNRSNKRIFEVLLCLLVWNTLRNNILQVALQEV